MQFDLPTEREIPFSFFSYTFDHSFVHSNSHGEKRSIFFIFGNEEIFFKRNLQRLSFLKFLLDHYVLFSKEGLANVLITSSLNSR